MYRTIPDRPPAPTVHERPVRRDPKTGLLDTHLAYEGWMPAEPPRRSSWLLVLAAVAFAVAAIWGAHA